MNESTPNVTWAHNVDLAQQPDFDLGSLRVRPARCEVEQGGVTQTVQRRVMQVLVTLAEARGSVVSHSDLVSRCWRGLSVSDDAIVRCISKLRKLAAGFPAHPYEIETIPGVGYRLTSSNFVEHGAKGELTARRRNRWSALAIAAATLLVLIGATFWVFFSRAPDRQPMRVAVQPFETLSNSEDVHSLARSVPNEIVNQLGDSQVEALLLGGDGDVPMARGALSLRVTGILSHDGHDTNVNVRIEDGSTRTALWSTQFRRADGQVSDLPLEVAARVTDAINMINFARSANPPLTDRPALSALLQTTDTIRDARGGDWAQMLEHAQSIVSRYPNFAFGHDVLAYAYVTAAENIGVPDRARAMGEAARREAYLTLKLDPKDAGAYVILAGLEPSYDYSAQQVILLRGVRVARHPKEALGGLYTAEAKLLENVGRPREALTWRLAAHAIDRWGAPKTAQLALNYANLGNLPAARGLIEKGIQLWPNHRGMRAKRQYIAGFYERPSDALEIIDSLDLLAAPDDSNAVWRTFVRAKAARPDRPGAVTIREIREAAAQAKIPPEIAIMMLVDLGATSEAIETANSIVNGEQLQSWFLFTPVTRSLRQDPGFMALATRMGLIRYWRETGKLPDFCTHQAKRSECSPRLLAALKTKV